MDTLKIIIEQGLAIRQIPLTTRSKFDYDHYIIGRELSPTDVVENWKPDIEYFQKAADEFGGTAEGRMNTFYKTFPKGRYFVVVTKIPKNAGYWMCKKVLHSDTLVKWDVETDNLAPTLSESVAKYLENHG